MIADALAAQIEAAPPRTPARRPALVVVASGDAAAAAAIARGEAAVARLAADADVLVMVVWTGPALEAPPEALVLGDVDGGAALALALAEQTVDALGVGVVGEPQGSCDAAVIEGLVLGAASVRISVAVDTDAAAGVARAIARCPQVASHVVQLGSDLPGVARFAGPRLGGPGGGGALAALLAWSAD